MNEILQTYYHNTSSTKHHCRRYEPMTSYPFFVVCSVYCFLQCLLTLNHVELVYSGDLHIMTTAEPQKIVKTLKGGHTATVRCLHWDNSVLYVLNIHCIFLFLTRKIKKKRFRLRACNIKQNSFIPYHKNELWEKEKVQENRQCIIMIRRFSYQISTDVIRWANHWTCFCMSFWRPTRC